MSTPEKKNRDVRVSVQISQQHASYAEQRAAWIEADELGVDVIFNWDHFYPLSGEPDGLHFEAYTQLGAMAEVTKRAQIGSLVTCNSYRNPNLLADMARTIDHISDGRFVLGIGSGWAERDYFNYGYEFGTAASRLKDLGRDLPIIEERMGKLNPGPVNGHIPVLIGGGGEKVTLKLVAQYADIWHAWTDLPTAEHKAEVLADWCAKVGRDPNEIERSTGINAKTQKDLDAYIGLGVTHFTIGIGGGEFDFGLAREMVKWRDSR